MYHPDNENQIIEKIGEGIIAIDGHGNIEIINRKAKEIFGIVYKQDIGHRSGRINENDIVIIGDNSLGFDDGGIDIEDLKLLGVDENIPQSSSFVYIGRYRGKGEWRYQRDFTKEKLSLSKKIDGINIEVEIKYLNNEIVIGAGGLSIPYSYIKGIGHIMILDGKTHELKFYQSKGYTIREEDLKSIIHGKNYMEKLAGREMEINVCGESITDVLKLSRTIENLIKSAKGDNIEYINRFDEINGRPVRCSIYPLINEKGRVGSFLKFEDLSEVRSLMEERDEILKRLLEVRDSINDQFDLLIGESEPMQHIKEYSRKAALSQSTILILGESGTGKSILARIIHNYSTRNKGRFVDINCGALSENLLESELFGYVPGAFTGARKEGKRGLIEYASGGTVFLDEISEMPISLQVKLLHVIQNRRFIPVGGTEQVEADVRFICAANKNLKQLVEKGEFREDLYYRINVVPITMPTLRERKEDLYSLTQSIIKKISENNNLGYKTLSESAFNKLYSYNFPGNIRELENILERAINISEDEVIGDKDIIINSENQDVIRSLKDILEETERKTIINYLRKFNGDKNKTMKALNIKKTAFYEKLNKYKI